MLPGLKTYQEPKVKELRQFVEKNNPNRRKLNSMIILIFGLFTLICTLISMSSRYENSMLYELLKQVQLFTLASVAANSSTDLSLRPVEIETRRDLVEYMIRQVPGNLFYSQKALSLNDSESATIEKEYDAPLLQREMEIVGQILVRATHVKLQDCDGPEKYRQCYPILDLTEDKFTTDDLREGAKDDPSLSWAVHKSAADLGLEERMIVGELSSYPNSGYVLTFDPHETSREEYVEKLRSGEGAFFGNGARTVTLDFAVYSDTLNYWVYV